MTETHFDLLVAGGGTGRDIVLAGEAAGLRVALVERGRIGGTCHNRGCMPSKMLIHSADLADAVAEGPRFGVHARLDRVDLAGIVRNVFATLDAESDEREAALAASDRVTFFQREGRFIGAKTMQVGDDVISADRVVIAGGSRPFVPPIPGLDGVPYLTSDEALHLETLPRRLAIVGGGYISCELAHFFGALGSAVTIIEPSQRLLSREDAEIGAAFSERYRTTHDVRLGARVHRVSATAGGVRVHLDGGEDVEADQLLVATGRTPNSDLLDLAAAGLALDVRGHVIVNEYLETGQDGVWALGDITGVLPLKHVAVRQARHISRALFDGDRRPMRYDVIPHAVFSAPQVAAVGRTEEELRAEGRPYKVGRWQLRDTAMGMALREDGLVKVLAAPDDTILGCHILGPNASLLIHEVAVAMTAGGGLRTIVDTVHAHPALSQVVEEACKAGLEAPVEAG